jgi:hypothetical protein
MRRLDKSKILEDLSFADRCTSILPNLDSVWSALLSSLGHLFRMLNYPNTFIRKSFSGNPTVSDRISKEAERGQYSRRI